MGGREGGSSEPPPDLPLFSVQSKEPFASFRM